MAKRAKAVKPTQESSSPLPVWMLDALGVLIRSHGLSYPSWQREANKAGVEGPQGARLSKAHLEQLSAALDELGLALERLDDGELEATPELELVVLEQLDRQGRVGSVLSLGRKPLEDAIISSVWRSTADPHLLQLAVIRNDAAALAAGVAYMTRSGDDRLASMLIAAFGLRPSARVLELLPGHAREVLVASLLEGALWGLAPIGPAVLEYAWRSTNKQLRLAVGRVAIMRGELDSPHELERLPKYGPEGLAVLAAFAAGDFEAAVARGHEASAAMKSRKRKLLPGIEGLVQVLVNLATSGSAPGRLRDAAVLLESQSRFDRITHSLHELCLGLSGERERSRFQLGVAHEWLLCLVVALHGVWLGAQPRSGDFVEMTKLLKQHHTDAVAGGYVVVARELQAVIDALSAKPGQGPSLATALSKPKPWEVALAGLEQVAAQASAKSSDAAMSKRRLVWELCEYGHRFEITPRLLGASGRGKGNKVALVRLLDGELDECLNDVDRRVLAAIETVHEWGSVHVRLGAGSLEALVGHPGVVSREGKPVVLERGEPKLRTQQVGESVSVDVVPDMLARHEHGLVEVEEGRYVFYRVTPELRAVLDVVKSGLEVPADGVGQLAQVLTRLTAVAGIGVSGALEPSYERVDADPRPVLLMVWNGAQLTVHLRVAPFGLDGPQLVSGIGNVSLTSELCLDPTPSDPPGQPRLLQTRRDLALERQLAQAFIDACPTLASFAIAPQQWVITTLADALEVLLELGHCGDQVVLAWPKGRVLHPPLLRDLDDLQVSVMGADAWLSVAAGLEVDEGRVLSFQELIIAREGLRFVALGPDRFIALSERLRRRIDALADIGVRKGDGLRASPAMLPVLEELTCELEHVEFDEASLARLARIRELADAQPRLPRGFRAKLRDYQHDGYAWMWRRAEAGLGACLADDMGLGKTVQALAVMLSRARSGPSLVVCPTSVVHNWVAEAGRFAPSLRPIVLANQSDRAASLAALGARDVLVCSYGVLVSEAEPLAAIEFASAVFDEAHALKNAGTKRASAARDIRAGFRLGLTGTPIENRVDELWSLFRVLVPGLLGSKAHFEDRFANPIAAGERAPAAQLRAIMRHFILRRTKAQVLDELPPRTEITVRVEPNAKQRDFYEALRRRARERIELSEPKRRRFRVLAEITCLRRAAVDPRLIDEAGAPAGAKLDAALEHLLALREEGHRALVFTQFLGSMALLRAGLDARGVEYLELDGSTPAAERARRVDAFQRGEGEVFLLSLRAGGVGMNLTGADYVLHLDPWWNPAVEDQATDRAHRIGQTRPVTVYRFVTAGSIEEKILSLHEHKRDLADDLLAGLEGTDALDLDELVALLDA